MDPPAVGQIIQICFLSTAPMQRGKLTFLSKSNTIFFQFYFEGVGRNSDFITVQIAMYTSFTTMLAVEIPILYV